MVGPKLRLGRRASVRLIPVSHHNERIIGVTLKSEGYKTHIIYICMGKLRRKEMLGIHIIVYWRCYIRHIISRAHTSQTITHHVAKH